jgi:hypothetical protein
MILIRLALGLALAAPAGADDASAAPDAAPTTSAAPQCPSDMVAVGAFCVDRYEAPNIVGIHPLLMQNAPDAEKWCAKKKKHLCSEAEWVRACKGPNGWKYPYGPNYEPGRCNDSLPTTYRVPNWTVLGRWPASDAKQHAAWLDQSAPSGYIWDSKTRNLVENKCASSEGVYDLTGNAAEWARRGSAHVVKGCYWYGCFSGEKASCDYTNGVHADVFRSYEFGFRCCKSPGDDDEDK